MTGLKTLRDGGKSQPDGPRLQPDHEKLRRVARELAEALLADDLISLEDVAEVFGSGQPSPPQPPTAGQAPDGISTPGAAPKPAARDTRRVMVVHGQDSAAATALSDWLRSIDLVPSQWSSLVKATGTGSPFIGDVLTKAFEIAQAVVVLFTPDEQTRLRVDLGRQTWRLQARPNVLFEAGMAFATHPDRTVLVVIGDQELPSDLAGRHFVRVTSAASLKDLAQRLETAGCPVDLDGSDWLDVARFPDRDGIEAAP